jgi:hypothetical protein
MAEVLETQEQFPVQAGVQRFKEFSGTGFRRRDETFFSSLLNNRNEQQDLAR